MIESEELAKLFHDIYETLAPQYGYETRKETRVKFDELPENNKKLMIAVCSRVAAVITAEYASYTNVERHLLNDMFKRLSEIERNDKNARNRR